MPKVRTGFVRSAYRSSWQVCSTAGQRAAARYARGKERKRHGVCDYGGTSYLPQVRLLHLPHIVFLPLEVLFLSAYEPFQLLPSKFWLWNRRMLDFQQAQACQKHRAVNEKQAREMALKAREFAVNTVFLPMTFRRSVLYSMRS